MSSQTEKTQEQEIKDMHFEIGKLNENNKKLVEENLLLEDENRDLRQISMIVSRMYARRVSHD